MAARSRSDVPAALVCAPRDDSANRLYSRAVDKAGAFSGDGPVSDVTLPRNAIRPERAVEGAGKPYSGANKYVMHFPKGQTPPADGFWSITMYNAAYFFVDNPLNKYTVSPRNALKYNADGSLDLYIQNESPGPDKEANWLPAPKDKFILMLRLYWPKEKDPSILDGSWKPPAVKVAAK